MPRTADASTSTDSTVAGGRLTVSLPKEVAADLNKLKQHFEQEFASHIGGIHVDLSPAQVIHAAVKELARVVAEAKQEADKAETAVEPASK